jgi:YVTN family beta-propeller protein
VGGELRAILVALLGMSLALLHGDPVAANNALWSGWPADDLAQDFQPLFIGIVGIGTAPLAIAVDPTTHQVYALGQQMVRVLDGSSAAVVGSIGLSLSTNATPGTIAVDPRMNRVYVGDSSIGTITTLDGATNSLVSGMSIQSGIWSLAVNPVTNRVYAATFNAVLVIGPTRNAVVGSVDIAKPRYTSVPSAVAVNPTTNRIYAVSGASNLISVIDGQTNQIVAAIDVGSGSAGIAANPTTNEIYTTQTAQRTLSVIDGKTNAILKTINLPSFAINNGVTVNSATNLVYVAANDQSVTVVDGTTGRLVATTAPLGAPSLGIAVDDATNRVYLPTFGGVAILAIGSNSFNPPALHDGRYFPQTGYRIDADVISDYFNRRGGVLAFGYPVSRTFLFQGFPIQIFQRRVVQLDANGHARLLNLLDSGGLPYTRFNGATFPSIDPGLVASGPASSDAVAVLAFVRANAPDSFGGRPVDFGQTFFAAVPYVMAFPNGGDANLLPGFDLELWGVPTSRPTPDPNNYNFVFLRFQRGIMMYDATCTCTQGVLLADYLKSILTGQNLPPDLDAEAQTRPFYHQYDPARLTGVHDPIRLPGSDLTYAFTPE